MRPSERIKHIKQITQELSKEEWALVDLTLKQFGLPWTDQWSGGDKESYVMDMIGNSDDESLLELAKHLGVASQLETTSEPNFWSAGEARIFLSHLAKHKVDVSELRKHLRDYGISAFVAHEDIEPTKEWQVEIESALSTMDGLVALLTPDFNESKWCDQEVGVAIGRQLPILAVRQGIDPYGFVGKYQALQGFGKTSKQLACEIHELFLPMSGLGAKITNVLVNDFIDSRSFDESRRLVSIIKQSKYLTSKHAEAMQEAVKNNSQISHSWGVPEQVAQIAKGFEG